MIANGLKLLTRLWLGFSHLSDCKSVKTVYPLCILAVRILKQQPISSITVPIIMQGRRLFTETSEDRVILQQQRFCYCVAIN